MNLLRKLKNLWGEIDPDFTREEEDLLRKKPDILARDRSLQIWFEHFNYPKFEIDRSRVIKVEVQGYSYPPAQKIRIDDRDNVTAIEKDVAITDTLPQSEQIEQEIEEIESDEPLDVDPSWLTVEKRRASEGVYAFVVRYKNSSGKKKVGLIDYVSIKDFNKRFSRRKRHYEAYRQQLIENFKAQALSASQSDLPDSDSAL
jgi:hypothetical protein